MLHVNLKLVNGQVRELEFQIRTYITHMKSADTSFNIAVECINSVFDIVDLENTLDTVVARPFFHFASDS